MTKGRMRAPKLNQDLNVTIVSVTLQQMRDRARANGCDEAADNYEAALAAYQKAQTLAR